MNWQMVQSEVRVHSKIIVIAKFELKSTVYKFVGDNTIILVINLFSDSAPIYNCSKQGITPLIGSIANLPNKLKFMYSNCIWLRI